VALGTVVVSKLFPNRYRSEATILVEPHKVPERYVVPNTTLDIRDALQAMTQTVLSRTQLLQRSGSSAFPQGFQIVIERSQRGTIRRP